MRGEKTRTALRRVYSHLLKGTSPMEEKTAQLKDLGQGEDASLEAQKQQPS